MKLFEMGWNDVLGMIRINASLPQQDRDEWLNRLIAGEIALPKKAATYKRGTVACAEALLRGETLDFKGPDWVVADLKRKVVGAVD